MMNLGNALLGEVPIFKIIVVGDSGGGKTNIVTRYVQDKFTDDEDATIAVQFFRRKVNIGSDSLWLHIWDTGGQERFQAITSVYYRGASGCILVFDLSNRKSFENVKRWYQKVYENAGETLFVLVGNKSDLGKKIIKRREINQLVDEFDCKYFECSAKTGNNVQFLFEYLNNQLMNGNRLKQHPHHHRDGNTSEEEMKLDGDEQFRNMSGILSSCRDEDGGKVSLVVDIGEDNEKYKKSCFCWDS